jgi:hypothetical protein
MFPGCFDSLGVDLGVGTPFVPSNKVDLVSRQHDSNALE